MGPQVNNWVFVTAGVGSKNFEQAANRLAKDVKAFNIFKEIICITNANIFEIVPKLKSSYTSIELEQTQGFGYYSWKSSIAESVMAGKFGKFDGMMFLDAGCEVLPSFLNIGKLLQYMNDATIYGATGFAIATPECQFTKSELFDCFPDWPRDDYSPQFQSGSWFLASEVGREIARKWNRIVWEKKSNVSDDVSKFGERKDFIVHRHDQSVFSLVLKEFGIQAHLHSIPGQPSNIFRFLIAIKHPFWWSRNRSGKSIIPAWIKFVGLVTLFPRKFYFLRLIRFK